MTARVYTADCIGDGHTSCDWHAEGDGADKAAEKHAAEFQHATTTHARPEGGKK